MLPARFLSLKKLRLLRRLVLLPRMLGLYLLIYTARRLTLLRLLVAPPQTLRPFCITFASSSKPWIFVMPTLVLLFYGN